MIVKGNEHTAQAIRERAMQHFRSHRNAQITIGMPASSQWFGTNRWLRVLDARCEWYRT